MPRGITVWTRFYHIVLKWVLWHGKSRLENGNIIVEADCGGQCFRS